MMSKNKSGPPKAPGKPRKAEPSRDFSKPTSIGLLFLKAMEADGSATTFQPKQTIYRQGDPADAVHYIVSGKIQLTVVSEQGKEAVIAILQHGEFFGEGCVAGQPSRMTSASATEKAAVIRIEKATMIRVLREQPEVAETLTAF